jgi:PEP-CTERM motif
MTKKLSSTILTLGLTLLNFTGSVSANPIGPDCDTCQGAIYTLSYDGSPISSTATTETFRVTYTIDTSSLDNFGAEAIDTVAIKVTNSVKSGSLFSAPAGNWMSNINKGLNANGCSNGGSGFICAMTTTDHTALVGGILNWVFDVEVNQGTLFTEPTLSTIKARYVDANGNKVGALVSEDIGLQEKVPEPGPLALLSIGLLGIGLRRFKKAA